MIPTCEELTSVTPDEARRALLRKARLLEAEAAELRKAADVLAQLDEVRATLAGIGPAQFRRLVRDEAEDSAAESVRLAAVAEACDWESDFWAAK